MNYSTRLPLIAASIFLAFGISACDKNSAEKTAPVEKAGPAEKAGKSIDNAVEKTGDKLQAASEKLGEQSDKVALAMDNSAITAKVKTALLAQAGLQAFKINVDTAEGVTTLNGAIDTQLNIDHAVEVARNVDGVLRVENKLTIKSAQ